MLYLNIDHEVIEWMPPPLSNWPDAIDHPKTPSKNKLRNLFFNYINMSAENIWRGIDKSSHVWRLSADSARIAQTCNSYLTFISYRWKLSESIPERFSYWDIFEYINIVHQWKQLHSLPSGFSIRRNKTGFQPQY